MILAQMKRAWRIGRSRHQKKDRGKTRMIYWLSCLRHCKWRGMMEVSQDGGDDYGTAFAKWRDWRRRRRRRKGKRGVHLRKMGESSELLSSCFRWWMAVFVLLGVAVLRGKAGWRSINKLDNKLRCLTWTLHLPLHLRRGIEIVWIAARDRPAWLIAPTRTGLLWSWSAPSENHPPPMWNAYNMSNKLTFTKECGGQTCMLYVSGCEEELRPRRATRSSCRILGGGRRRQLDQLYSLFVRIGVERRTGLRTFL